MRKFICIGLVSLVMACATDHNFAPSDEETCRIGRFVYKQDAGKDVSYKVGYTDGSFTQVSLVTEETLFGTSWTAGNVYKHIYKNDSVYIKDFRQFKEGATYVTGLFQDVGSEAQTIVTNFPDNGGTYRYSFAYTQDKQQVTVTLEKMSGNVATFDSRGIYKFTNGDVDTLIITRNPDIHGSDPDPFTTRTKTYTYDIVKNPLQNLVIAHFIKPELPDVTYFSDNNRVTEKYNDQTRKYTFVYGTDPMPATLTTPEGVLQKFTYDNCTN